jgi:hypothetical protein
MLPRVDLPTYRIFLKSLNEEIKYRPFTVGEQEILLRAKPNTENYDKKEILNAVSDIIEKCTFNKIDVRQLPMFEIIHLFIKIRCVSVEENVKFTYLDKSTEKEHRVIVTVNLNDIDITYPDNHSNIVMITESIGIKMKYPSWKIIEQNASNNSEEEFIVSCFDSIFDADNVYDSSDASKTELVDWYNALGYKEKLKIETFFNTMPHIYYSTKIKLRNGKEQLLEYKSLEDFFI